MTSSSQGFAGAAPSRTASACSRWRGSSSRSAMSSRRLLRTAVRSLVSRRVSRSSEGQRLDAARRPHPEEARSRSERLVAAHDLVDLGGELDARDGAHDGLGVGPEARAVELRERDALAPEAAREHLGQRLVEALRQRGTLRGDPLQPEAREEAAAELPERGHGGARGLPGDQGHLADQLAGAELTEDLAGAERLVRDLDLALDDQDHALGACALPHEHAAGPQRQRPGRREQPAPLAVAEIRGERRRDRDRGDIIEHGSSARMVAIPRPPVNTPELRRWRDLLHCEPGRAADPGRGPGEEDVRRDTSGGAPCDLRARDTRASTSRGRAPLVAAAS